MGQGQTMMQADREKKLRKKEKVIKKEKKKQKPEIQQNQLKVPLQDSGPVVEPPVDIGRLDLRVVKIIWYQPHPLASNTHYMYHVHANSPCLDLVVSELVEHYGPKEIEEGRSAVVVRNIKQPLVYGLRPWGGQLLCAVKDGKAELLRAPVESKAYDKVYVYGYRRSPDEPYMKPYKRIYETVVEDLWVNKLKQVTYKGVPLKVWGKGVITTDTLSDCPVRCV